MTQVDSSAPPRGWCWTTLREIAEVKGGITKGQKRRPTDVLRDVPYLRVANVQRGFLDLADVKPIEATQEEIDDLRLQQGDILFNEGGDRDKLGRGWVWHGELPECIHQNHVFRARLYSPAIVPKYISLYGNAAGQKYFSDEGRQTTNLASLNLTKLGQFPIALPPADEQRRIVAEIEKHFTRLDAAVASLKRAQAGLKRYRAAVLKAACEGRLVPTEADLAQREGRDYEPAERLVAQSVPSFPGGRKRAGRLWGAGFVPSLTREERSNLPEGWVWTKVRDLGADPDETVQVGPMSMRSQDFEDGGVPVLNVGCVRWGGFDETKLNFLPHVTAAAFGRYRVRPGDVLFTRSGTVGRCAVARDHHRDWLITFHLLRVRVDGLKCVPFYLRAVFEGAGHIRRQTREASIGTTRAGFNTNLLADLDVPLPPHSEQRRIVAEVERRLSIVEEQEAAIRAGLAHAERLRQAILKRAFEGKLVPQDPADEPAAALLARIRADRDAAGAAGTGRARRSRTNGKPPGEGGTTATGAESRASVSAGAAVQPHLPHLS